jgi:GntR family transcriptional regulator/MocR family aminotransferase
MLEVDLLRSRLGGPGNLYEQVYQGLRDLVLEGRLQPGYRLLPTRRLADELSISRTTVTQAYRQLTAEGYVESLVGSGTRVRSAPALLEPRGERLNSRRGLRFESDRLEYEQGHYHAEAFCPAAIDTEHFPHELWGRSLARVWRSGWRDLMSYQGPGGWPPLQRAICAYLAEHRELRCQPEQVVVVAGAQQGLDLAARVLTDPGDRVGLEEPGYLGARSAFRAAEAVCLPLAVDEEGVNPSEPLRVVCCAPSHQFPTGVCMSVARRLQLLRWAELHSAWIVEDDYDSEFRYNSRPIPSLKSLDMGERVVYVGSFSKLLHPSIRIGYLVLPPDLVTAFHGAKACSDRQTNLQLQAALVDFLECEAFGRHVKRMREVYGARRALLLDELRAHLAGFLAVNQRDAAGLHLSARLPVDDWQFHLRARQFELEVNSFSQYSLGASGPQGVVLGFAGLDRAAIRSGVERLARVASTFK